MWSLGGIYRAGEWTVRDYLEARKWLKRAAEAGDLLSLQALGEMAENGEGTNPDKVEAYKWFSISCAEHSGSLQTPACSEMDELEKHLPPSDILKAQSLASAWQKQFRK
jgi:TPR repeat protein